MLDVSNRRPLSVRIRLGSLAVCTIGFLCGIQSIETHASSMEEPPENAAEEVVARDFEMLDLDRTREIIRITDMLGDDLWPGFDTHLTSLAINHDDRQEILVGHPYPPVEYRKFGSETHGGRQVWIRDGVTRFGPRGGGWGIDIGSNNTAYMSTLAPGQSTESYLSVLMHESFHVYQVWYRQTDQRMYAEFPVDNIDYAALLSLEGQILQAAVKTPDVQEKSRLGRLFIAVREHRREGLPFDLIRYENEQEFFEGTPLYIETRMAELLRDRGGLTPIASLRDPHYQFFANAGELFDLKVKEMIPTEGDLTTFEHAMYYHGMGQGMILDAVRPDWKLEMRERDITPYDLMIRQFTDLAEGDAHLLAEAQKQFDYASLYQEQEDIVNERIATMRRVLEGPGRIYRVHHRVIPGRFNWKPVGPSYVVPASIMASPSGRVLIWMGGIREFIRGDLVFKSEETPIVYQRSHLQWIDTDPAEDGSDFVLTSESSEGDVYTNVHITTDGFQLDVPKAIITITDEAIDITPVVEG